jgi:hypothetical protein
MKFSVHCIYLQDDALYYLRTGLSSWVDEVLPSYRILGRDVLNLLDFDVNQKHNHLLVHLYLEKQYFG